MPFSMKICCGVMTCFASECENPAESVLCPIRAIGGVWSQHLLLISLWMLNRTVAEYPFEGAGQIQKTSDGDGCMVTPLKLWTDTCAANFSLFMMSSTYRCSAEKS